MEKPSLVLFGSIGQIGGELNTLLRNDFGVLSPSLEECDFLRPDTVTDYLQTHQPQWIVNAAAWTDVDGAEDHPNEAHLVNAVAPERMAQYAAKAGAQLIHFSTDYVYPGDKDGVYLETDPTGPLGEYGKSKLAGDEAVIASGCAHVILRVSWVYGLTGKNFLLTMLRVGADRESLGVVDDQVGAPSWSRFLAETTADVARKLAGMSTRQAASLSGVYHLAPTGSTSWHGFASRIFALAGTKRYLKVNEVKAISSADWPAKACRPMNSVLDTSRLRAVFALELPSWEECLQKCLQEL